MKNRLKIHDNWETPKEFLDNLKKEFGEMFDPCPLDNQFDGLKIEWAKVNFVNPPYDRILKEKFIEKARKEQLKGNTSIMLLPVSTSTRVFHEVIYPNCEIRFIRGRLKFKGYNSKGIWVKDKCGQHDSMLCIFNGGSLKD